ncbi:MAG: hypothetical protein ACYTBZ_31550 [Planctomycetota bacterium]
MGCVCIDFGGLDKQENINKFNSAEYGFIAIDQAEETSRDDVSVAQGSLRLKIKGVPLSYKELYTANPRQCWLREEFILAIYRRITSRSWCGRSATGRSFFAPTATGTGRLSRVPTR